MMQVDAPLRRVFGSRSVAVLFGLQVVLLFTIFAVLLSGLESVTHTVYFAALMEIVVAGKYLALPVVGIVGDQIGLLLGLISVFVSYYIVAVLLSSLGRLVHGRVSVD